MGLILLCASEIMYAQKSCLSQNHTFIWTPRNVGLSEPITIPVVVHVLYKTEDQFISAQQVQDQIQMLTADFRRQNSDTLQTPAVFQGVAADTEIEFCLATRGPDGEEVSGVNLLPTEEAEIGITGKFSETREGGQDTWDAGQYLNIWVCEILEDGSIAGFSSLPGEDDDWDGVVIDYRYFGLDTSLYPHHLGRTLTHEVGHWLGLNHTWGDEDNCNVDDGVEDTPLQQQAYRDCPTGDQFSCNSQDMYMNFMDLVNDDCMNLFTQGQKIRMHETIDQYRSTIRSSPGCALITSIAASNLQEKLRIYPNPTRDYMHVDYINDKTFVPEKVSRLFDLQGRLQMQSSSDRIDVRDLPGGLYLLKIQIGSEVSTQKILIL